MAKQPLKYLIMNKEKFILILIITLGFLIRIFNTNYPPLLWDEAALGYNAYSILQTSRDEHGHFLPLIFKSFGDYKPGLYVYLTIPFVAIFGLNSLAVRLPSIILGSLLPLLAYLIAKKFSQHKYLPLIFAAVIAFNPYNIHYSKGAWETNILTFELLLASYFFLSKKYLPSALVFGLSLFTYQSGKMASLFLIITLLVTSFSKEYFQKSFLLKFILPLLIFSLPILYGLLFQNQGNRLNVVSLLSYPRSNEEKNLIINESNKTDYQIFHNKLIYFSKNFLNRYFNHFSPKFLLTQGDWQNPRHGAPYSGVLLIPSFFFLLIGVFGYFLKSNKSLLDKFFILWLLLSPIPAALTRDEIQATRIMNFSLPLCYFTALGLKGFFEKYTHYIFKILMFGIYFVSLYYYLDLYFVHMVKKSPESWLYGYKESMYYAINNGQNSLNYFSDYYGQPYIYYLFYSQYPPQKYQSVNHLSSDTVDTGKVHQIDNYIFENPNFNYLLLQSRPILGVFSSVDVATQNIDKSMLSPLSPVNSFSTFYGYKNF